MLSARRQPPDGCVHDGRTSSISSYHLSIQRTPCGAYLFWPVSELLCHKAFGHVASLCKPTVISSAWLLTLHTMGIAMFDIRQYIQHLIFYWGCNTLTTPKSCLETESGWFEAIIARTHAHAEIVHFPMKCIIRACNLLGRRRSAFQVWWCTKLENVRFLHKHGLLLSSHDLYETSAIRKSCISTHPFSAWNVSWSWDDIEVLVLNRGIRY